MRRRKSEERPSARVATSFRRAHEKKRPLAYRVPGVGALAALFARIAAIRRGRAPVGLLLLLPLAMLLDAYDIVDELALGPLGMGLSFLVESEEEAVALVERLRPAARRSRGGARSACPRPGWRACSRRVASPLTGLLAI